MKRSFIKSSCLRSVGYESNSRILEIEFNSGSIYQYFDVPLDVYQALINSQSPGRYLHFSIAYKFKYNLIGNETYKDLSTQKKQFAVCPTDIGILRKKLAIRFHPDNPEGSEKQMKEINILYDERNYNSLREIAFRHNVH